jgi:CRP/FNR family transcriptional regulator, cyclic AMP receptor protein
MNPNSCGPLGHIALLRCAGLIAQLDDMRRLPLNVRTGKFLLSAAHSSRVHNVLSNTQSDIAYALGASRVSIGKILKKFEQANYIELGYGKIHISDKKGLRRWVTAHRQA